MRAVMQAVTCLVDLVFGRAVDGEIGALRGDTRGWLDEAEMQHADMAGVEIALDRLQPIAAPLYETHLHAVRRPHQAFEMRQVLRRLVAVAHIDPDDAVMLFRQIRLGMDLI